MAKFTPGPWFAEPRENRDFAAELDGGERCEWVAVGPATGFSVASAYMYGEEQNEANAHLIAASPELYEIVKAVVSRLGPGGYDPGIGAPMTEKARAILQRIDGAAS